MNKKSSGFTIPAQPKVLTDIGNLLRSGKFDTNTLTGLIGKDAALSARILKTVNAPFFSRGRAIHSIGQAVNILGASNLNTVIVNSALKSAYTKISSKALEQFWKHSEFTAMACSLVAGRCCKEHAENAYLVGLFHDCAVPLFFAKHDDYGELFERSLRCGDFDIVGEEEKRYSTNHSVVGYLFCRTWRLEETVSLAVKHHHANLKLGSPEDLPVETLVAVLLVADRIIQNFDLSEPIKALALEEWAEKHKPFMSLLGLYPEDMLDLREDFLDKAFVH